MQKKKKRIEKKLVISNTIASENVIKIASFKKTVLAFGSQWVSKQS